MTTFQHLFQLFDGNDDDYQQIFFIFSVDISNVDIDLICTSKFG